MGTTRGQSSTNTDSSTKPNLKWPVREKEGGGPNSRKERTKGEEKPRTTVARTFVLRMSTQRTVEKEKEGGKKQKEARCPLKVQQIGGPNDSTSNQENKRV